MNDRAQEKIRQIKDLGKDEIGRKNLFNSINHDLARSYFQFWPKIGDEGDKRNQSRPINYKR